MTTTAALPNHSHSNSCLTAKPETPSKTTARPNRFHKDRPRQMSPSAVWTAVEVPTLDEMCDRDIQWMLDRCGGNREAAARLLGIGRTSLYRYLKKLAPEKRDTATINQLRDRHFRSPDPSSPKCERDRDSYANARKRSSWDLQLIQALLDSED
jgi:hypothetical protein